MNRNQRLGLICVLVFTGMVGAAYAAVPLYRLFCQKTGFAGTPRRAAASSGVILDRKVTVSFDTNVHDVPFTFTAGQAHQEVRVGDTALAYFKVTNNGAKAVTARAAYNVLPDAVGAFFTKLECFCFKNQTLAPGQSMEFPVVYTVDHRFADDRDTKGQGEITLSYTFFPAVVGVKGSDQPLGKAAPARL